MFQLRHLKEALRIETTTARDTEAAIRNADDTCRRELDASLEVCQLVSVSGDRGDCSIGRELELPSVDNSEMGP